MEITPLQGMHCFHKCIITYVNHLGVKFASAFATLWSETDFRYDPLRGEYLTKRLITNLNALGVKVVGFDCFSPEDTQRIIATLCDGEHVIVGIDAYYVPWSQFCGIFHGAHYFIVQMTNEKQLLCIDPTFDKPAEYIDRDIVASHGFDLYRVTSAPQSSWQPTLADEAGEVLTAHPAAQRALLESIRDCAGKDQQSVLLLAKYISSMICNRHMFRMYLDEQPERGECTQLFYGADFFSGWTAVKNGLFKASVSPRRERTLDAVCNRFNDLMNRELDMAKTILSMR